MKECNKCGEEFAPSADQPLIKRVVDHFEDEHGLGTSEESESN